MRMHPHRRTGCFAIGTAAAILWGLGTVAHAEPLEDRLETVGEALQDEAVTDELDRSELEHAMALHIEGQQHFRANMRAEAREVVSRAEDVLGIDD